MDVAAFRQRVHWAREVCDTVFYYVFNLRVAQEDVLVFYSLIME